MESKDIDVNGTKFKVNELLAIEFDEIQKLEDSTARVVETIKKSANLSEEDYKKLTMKERSLIQKTMSELNGWNDFQRSETEESK